MEAIQRIGTVLRHEKPDRTPFAPNENLLPRGEMSRSLRNRGMGMCTAPMPVLWSGWPNVRFKARSRGCVTLQTWETPAGSISRWRRSHACESDLADCRLPGEGWIKRTEDYDPVIAVIEDEQFYEDHVAYEYATRDLGRDSLVKVAGLRAPYYASYAYFEDGTAEGLGNWLSAQCDHPSRFDALLQALECREERRFATIANSPGDVMCLEGVSGCCAPEQFEKHELPFFQKYVPLLHKAGKTLCLKTDGTNLKAFSDLIPHTGVDVVEGFMPPPYGDLPLDQARAAWGDRVIIWVNFPTAIFHQGLEATRWYTLDLLESDPSGALVLGITALDRPMDADDETMSIMAAGMSAIMDAIVEFHGS